MHMVTRFSGAIGCLMFAALIAVTTSAYLEQQQQQLVKSDHSLAENLLAGDDESAMLKDVPSMSGRHRRLAEHIQKKRQGFSVTQDLDALAEMLREAAMRRRLQNAIAFFNALKKRDTESTYGHMLPPQKENDSRK